MAALGPFERAPRLAVAVSGGSDSMALALLAAAWARQAGGDAVALAVDHRLRRESADEAGQVGRWLAARGIEHHILPWNDARPGASLQAAEGIGSHIYTTFSRYLLGQGHYLLAEFSEALVDFEAALAIAEQPGNLFQPGALLWTAETEARLGKPITSPAA